MARSVGHDSRAYRRARDHLRRNQAPCHICGRPIDYTLPHTEPQSFQADHVIPLKFGGHHDDPANLRASHRTCNRTKGTKATSEITIIPQSRRW